MLSWLTSLLCPPTKSASYKLAESCFTKEELDAIRKEHCVHVLSQYAQTIDDQHFLQWAGLEHAAPALQQGLCNAVRRLSGLDATAITLDGVVVAKARCEKMDRLSAEDFAFDVIDVDGTGRVTRDHLQAVIRGCLQLALTASHINGSEDTTVTAAAAAAAAAIAAGACSYSDDSAAVLTREGYAKFCKASPALNSSILSLLCDIGRSPATATKPNPDPTTPPKPLQAASAAVTTPSGSTASLIDSPAAGVYKAGSRQQQPPGPGPGSTAAAAGGGSSSSVVTRCPGRVQLPSLGWGLCAPDEGLLQPGWVWWLAAGLAPSLRQEWRLLFNCVKHGMSFSTFIGRLGEAAPTLLLIRDKGGAVFGGIAHQPWKKQGTFYGDYASVIFSLLPTARIYPASGINNHIQWCGVGFSQLPNGLGFGGQVGHFGVWIDETLDTGMSRPAATFASPSLSSSQTFQVDVVEAWLLLPPEEQQQQSEPGSSAATPGSSKAGLSALDKAKEDRQILEWAGVGSNYSAAVRDEPIED